MLVRDMDADDYRTLNRFRLLFGRHTQDMVSVVVGRKSEHASCENNDQSRERQYFP